MLKAAALANFVLLSALAFTTSSAFAVGIKDCKAFEREHKKYVATGIRADMERGPEWAKSNLPANRVQQVLRFLYLEEQLRFRCEDVFAEAELVEMERRAEAEAHAKALANIPPPPIQRPQFAKLPNSKRYILVPPLPERRLEDSAVPQQP